MRWPKSDQRVKGGTTERLWSCCEGFGF